MKEANVKMYKAVILIILFFAYTILIPSTPTPVKLILDLVIIVVALFLFKDDIRENVRKLAKHRLKTISIIIVGFLVVMLLQALFGAVFEKVFNIYPPSGESQIALFKTAPWYLIFSMLVFSPIVEELTFRKAFRTLIKNKWLYMIVSSVLYGALYVVFGVQEPISYIFIISYSLITMVYAFVYLKTDNIFVPIFIHLLQNAFAMLAYMALLAG